ncbi:MAG: hypothetical protein DMG39_06855 [Acidobacteria bacterium]|nr:MAG: hypothetical protein DMG39_06855 [Acidobacteriota bacterium]
MGVAPVRAGVRCVRCGMGAQVGIVARNQRVTGNEALRVLMRAAAASIGRRTNRPSDPDEDKRGISSADRTQIRARHSDGEQLLGSDAFKALA